MVASALPVPAISEFESAKVLSLSENYPRTVIAPVLLSSTVAYPNLKLSWSLTILFRISVSVYRRVPSLQKKGFDAVLSWTYL